MQDRTLSELKAHYPGWGQDGQALHDQLGSERWCVTKDDFKFLRREIQTAVRKGQIAPITIDAMTGKGDPFDPEDNITGPNMYNVVENFLKPLTNDAGKMSWALLRHPRGLHCEVFITHCWAEGAYELIDKVVASWPRGKRNAWCCILAIPQNLPIGNLIGVPSLSPFAVALRTASHMMVVSNAARSPYTRVWCVYEAYLAHTHDKLIFTARAPLTVASWQRHRGRALECALLGLVAGAVVPAWSLANPAHASDPAMVPAMIGSLAPGGLLGLASLLLSFTDWYTAQSVASALGLFVATFNFASVWRHYLEYPCYDEGGQEKCGLDDKGQWVIVVCIIAVAFWSASEVQRMRGSLLRREQQALRSRVNSCADAEATCEDDKRSILEEIGDKLPEVDNCINTLVTRRLSTNGQSDAPIGSL